MGSDALTALLSWLACQAGSFGLGNNIFLAGGALRDALSNRTVNDIDLVVDGNDAEEVANKFAAKVPAETKITVDQHGVVLLHIVGSWDRGGHEMKGLKIDIAPARDGDIEAYVGGWDFTFNALVVPLSKLQDGVIRFEDVIDPTGRGVQDLKARRIVFAADPETTIAASPMRLLRVVKFAERGFRATRETELAVRASARFLTGLPHSAVSNELLAILRESGDFAGVLHRTQRLGLLEHLQAFAEEEPSFAAALNSWADSIPLREALMVRNYRLPAGQRLRFIACREEHRKVLERLVWQHGNAAADAWLAVYNQPGKALDNRRVLAEHPEYRGKLMQGISCLARELLVAQPHLLEIRGMLTATLLHELQTRHEELPAS